MIEQRVESHMHGHAVYYDPTISEWRYQDTNEVAEVPSTRPCKHCNRLPTPEGHDGCLGTIPGAMFACCGHGIETGYIAWDVAKEVSHEFELPRWFGWVLSLFRFGSPLENAKPVSISIRYNYRTEDAEGYASSR